MTRRRLAYSPGALSGQGCEPGFIFPGNFSGMIAVIASCYGHGRAAHATRAAHGLFMNL